MNRFLPSLIVAAAVSAFVGCSDNGILGPVEPPTLASLTPDSGVRGSTVEVTLTGTNFGGETRVAVSGGGVTVSDIRVTSESIAADFVIAAEAALGERNVTVTTARGTTGIRRFTVRPPAPTLEDITPDTGIRGNTVALTLTGTNFVPDGTAVSVLGGHVVVENVRVASATSLTADLVIEDIAGAGERDVLVTTAGGTTDAQTFTIHAPQPILTDVTPDTGVRGTTVSVTLTGTDLITATTRVDVSGGGVTVSNLSNESPTSLRADFRIADDAALGQRDVAVTTGGPTTGGGTTDPRTFTVLAP